jgi:SAM-dependent methyltransferase
MPAVGRTVAAAVHRPLAEQLAGVAAIGACERVLELSAGDGELTAHLLSTPGAPALTVVVADVHQTGTVRAALGPAPVELVIAPASRLPFADNAFDLAVSLLAIESGDQLAASLTELARVARRSHVVLWTDGATHENALRDAITTAPTTPQSPAQPLPAGWTQSTLGDVARFDGIGQLWLALVTERGIDIPEHQDHAVRERLQENVAAFTAADGTMRIPVRATLLSLRQPSGGISPR